MYTLGKFSNVKNQTGDIIIPRNGVVEQVVLPEALKDTPYLEPDLINGKIVMGNGELVHILTDKIGLVRNGVGVHFNLFFVDGGMVIELHQGELLLEGENGEKFIIDEVGDISYPRSNAVVQFKDYKWLKDSTSILVSNRYGVTSAEGQEYTDNLMLEMSADLISSGYEPCFTIKVLSVYEDIADDRFVFLDMAEINAVFNDDDSDEPFSLGDEDKFVDVDDLQDEAEREAEIALIGSDDDDVDF